MQASGKTGGQSFVHRTLPDSVDFISKRNETGTITSQQDNHCIDSVAGFITAGIAVNDWIRNTTDEAYAQVTAVNSETDLTLDANIFPDDDNDGYFLSQLRQQVWSDLDLSSIIDAGSVLVKLYVKLDGNSTTQRIFFRKKGDTSTLEMNGLKQIVANLPTYGTIFVACDDDGVGIIQYRMQLWDNVCDIVIGGWWK